MYLGGGDLNGIFFFFSPIDPATIGNCAFGQKSPGESPVRGKGKMSRFLPSLGKFWSYPVMWNYPLGIGLLRFPLFPSPPTSRGRGERERRGRRKRRRRRLAPPPPPVMLPAGILLPPPSVASSSFGEPLRKDPFSVPRYTNPRQQLPLRQSRSALRSVKKAPLKVPN